MSPALASSSECWTSSEDDDGTKQSVFSQSGNISGYKVLPGSLFALFLLCFALTVFRSDLVLGADQL